MLEGSRDLDIASGCQGKLRTYWLRLFIGQIVAGRPVARASSSAVTMANDNEGTSSGDVRRVLIAMDGSEHSFYAFDCEFFINLTNPFLFLFFVNTN